MISLVSNRVALSLDPDFGARVVSLKDRATGREWLVQGARDGDPSDAATYGGAQARGWDECLPTVAPCTVPGWGRLRDHGVAWARPWKVDATAVSVTAIFVDPRLTFTRVLTLDDATLTCSYTLTLQDALPWMWSQHCLLDAQPGERIVLDGLRGFTAGGKPVDWPRHDGRDLSDPTPDGSATKLYAAADGPVTAGIDGPRGGIRFAWDGADIPAIGLWLDRGGWPDDDPVTQVAIEPTTAPADDLAAACADGTARKTEPLARVGWSVAISVVAPT